MIDAYGLCVFIGAILIHEAGHYFFAYFMNAEPKFGLRWWGITMKTNGHETLAEKFHIALAGIMWGAVPVWLLLDYTWMVTYGVICFIDIAIIFGLLELSQESPKGWHAKAGDFETCYKGKKSSYKREQGLWNFLKIRGITVSTGSGIMALFTKDVQG